MALVINLPSTAAQEASAERVLVGVNLQRVAEGKTAYTGLEDWFSWIIRDHVLGYVKHDQDSIRDAYQAATFEVKEAVRTVLGL